MSAWAQVPPPEAGGATSGEVDLGDELEGLRRRGDEQTAVLKKHQAAVTQLADSVSALVALGRRRSRWINLNSFVAYVLFTVLLGGALFFLYRSRIGELEARRAQAIAERDLARVSAGTAAAHDDVLAMALYATMRSGDDVALIAREAEIAGAALTAAERAMFTDAIGAAKSRLSGHVVDDGVGAFKAGKWAEAATIFERAIADNPTGPRAAQWHYYAGVAKWKQADHAGAVLHLEPALAGTLDAAAADARYFFAASLDKLGKLDRARTEFDRFASAFPRNPLAVYARRRSAMLARIQARGAHNVADPDGEHGEPRHRAAPPVVAPEPVAPAPEPDPVPAVPPAADPGSPPPP